MPAFPIDQISTSQPLGGYISPKRHLRLQISKVVCLTQYSDRPRKILKWPLPGPATRKTACVVVPVTRRPSVDQPTLNFDAGLLRIPLLVPRFAKPKSRLLSPSTREVDRRCATPGENELPRATNSWRVVPRRSAGPSASRAAVRVGGEPRLATGPRRIKDLATRFAPHIRTP